MLKASDYRLLFFIASFIFVTYDVAIYVFGTVSLAVQVSTLVAAVLFFVCSFTFLLNSEKKKFDRLHGAIIVLCFILLLADLVALSIFTAGIGKTVEAYVLSAYEYIGTNIVLFLPVIFLMFFGLFLNRHRYRKASYVLFAVAIALVIFYFFSGMVFHHYKIDDEELILWLSSKSLVSGTNPYSVSFAQQLFINSSNSTINSPSITTGNRIIGTLNYPSLFLLSFLPFYLSSQPLFSNLVNFDLEVQEMVFLLFVLAIISLSLKDEFLKKPVYSIIIFVTVVMAYLSSIEIFLMFALLLLAYVKLGSRYSWLLLGLCASLQEQLWFPVALLLIYSANNYGIKQGLRDLVGAGLVFVALNAYFIAGSSGSFFSSLFSPISQLLFPQNASPAGFLLVTNYPMPLGSYETLFLLSMVALAIGFVYSNEKRLVGLFGMVPFIFLSHSIPIYYTFFTGFTIVTLFVKSDGRKLGVLTKWFRRRRHLAIWLIAVIVVASAAFVYLSHAAYVKNFNLTVSSTGLYFDALRNQTVYSAVINYGNLSNYTVYVVVGGVAMYNVGFVGFEDYGIIQNSTLCPPSADYSCHLNTNVIDLPRNRTSYTVKTYLGGTGGYPFYAARLYVYNKEYFAVSNGTSNQTIFFSRPS